MRCCPAPAAVQGEGGGPQRVRDREGRGSGCVGLRGRPLWPRWAQGAALASDVLLLFVPLATHGQEPIQPRAGWLPALFRCRRRAHPVWQRAAADGAGRAAAGLARRPRLPGAPPARHRRAFLLPDAAARAAPAQPAPNEGQGQLCDQPQVGGGGCKSVWAGAVWAGQARADGVPVLAWSVGCSRVLQERPTLPVTPGVCQPHLCCSKAVRWLGRKAEELGVEVFPGFAGARVAYGPGGDVHGVQVRAGCARRLVGCCATAHSAALRGLQATPLPPHACLPYINSTHPPPQAHADG